MVIKEVLMAVIGAGFFAFIQFLISHFTESKTHVVDRKENVDSLRTELKQHLEDTNIKWKEDYCDRNTEAIEELRKAVLALTEDAKERAKYERYMGESLMALTHDKLVHLGKCYQRRGAITLAEQSNLTMLFKPYHDGLGGNSDGETWYNYCMEDLPVVSDAEAMKMDEKRHERT